MENIITNYYGDKVELVVGRLYSAIGTCGESKDKDVLGELTDFNFQHGEATIFAVTPHQPCSVNIKTLQPIHFISSNKN